MIEKIEGGKASWGSRSDRIGASDIPIILGISPFKKPHELWEQKKNSIIEEESLPALVGNAVEGVLFSNLKKSINRLRKEQSLPEINVENLIHNESSYRNLKYGEWATATPDGFGDPDYSIQIKYSKSKAKWGGLEVPPDVYAQVQWEMLITERKRTHLYCTLETYGWEFSEIYFEIEFNESFCLETLFPKAIEFWESLKEDQNPYLLKQATTVIPVCQAKVRIPTKDQDSLCQEYLKLNEAKAPLTKEIGLIEKKQKDIKDRILGFFEDAQYLNLSDGRKLKRTFVEKKPYTVAGSSYYQLKAE